MPLNNRRLVTIETWTVLKVLAILLLCVFLYLIRDILTLIFVALFLAALIHPAARALAKRKIPKGLTVLVIYALLFGFAVFTVGLLLPPLIDQSARLLNSLGKSWQLLANNVHSFQDLLTKYGLSEDLQAGVQSLESQITRAASGLFSTLTEIFGGIVGLIVVLVMAYYIVVQEEEARHLFRNFVPEEYQEIVANVLRRVEEKIGHWLLGQLSLCVIIGILYYIGLSVIGIQSALALAVFGGFTEFIPYLGPILGAIPIVLLALSESPFKALLALAVLLLIQQLEGHIIVPKVMQKAIGINPLVSILALLVGAKLFGFIGALLAIPIATTLSVVLSELYRYVNLQRRS